MSCVQKPPIEVGRCEDDILANLLAPATYKRFDYTVSDIVVDNRPLREVYINYDAQNAFGALLRQAKDCRFPIANGEADIFNQVSEDELGNQLNDEFKNGEPDPKSLGKIIAAGK
jgi:hypothetical protein